MKQLTILFILILLVSSISPGQNMFVTGYYPVWSIGSTNGGLSNAMYPDQMNWQGLTHVVHFGTGPTDTPPFWNPQGNNSFGGPSNDSLNLMYGVDWRGNTNYKFIDSLRKYAHAVNAKLLLSCGGIWGAQASNMNYITSDSGRTQLFVNTFIAFCSRNQYDGVEIDYEPPGSQTQMSLLTRIMKRRMTQVLGASAELVITVANLAEVNYSLALKDSVAQYMFMMYDMHNPYNGIASPGSQYDVTGYNGQLHLADPNQYPILGTAPLNYDGARPAITSVTWGPNKFATMGFPKSKIVVGIPFYGYVFDGKNAPNQSASGVYAHYLNYCDAIRFQANTANSYHFDNTAKVPWLGGTATQSQGWVITQGHQTYITYDDVNSVAEKVRWAKNGGFGGMMIYELWTGWVASASAGQRDPLLRALVNEVNNTPASNPTVTTGDAVGITQTTATLPGTVNPNGSGSLVRVRIKLSSAGSWQESLLVSSNVSTFSSLSIQTTGRAAGTSYDYQYVAYNVGGSGVGSIKSFTTLTPPPQAPTVSMDSVGSIGITTATAYGRINANGTSTTGWMLIGTTSGVYTDSLQVTQNPITGSSTTPVSKAFTGLAQQTRYYMANAGNSAGGYRRGNEVTFVTLPVPATAPTVSTGNASGTTTTGTNLFGTVNDNGASATVTFYWRIVGAPSFTSQAASQSPVSGGVPVTVSLAIGSLTPSTDYEFKVGGSNSVGSTEGQLHTFRTGAIAALPSKVLLIKVIQ